MTPPELLRQAADRVTPETWCQGELADGTGRFCAMGHLQQVDGVTPTYYIALAAVKLWVGRIDAWNDRPGMTAHRVREGLLSTADALEHGALGPVVRVGSVC